MVDIYCLYFDERKLLIEIKPFGQGAWFNGIKVHNENCLISCDRRILRDRAKFIRTNWILKREMELDMLRNLKIKNKYYKKKRG